MHIIDDTDHNKYFGKGKKPFQPIVSIKMRELRIFML